MLAAAAGSVENTAAHPQPDIHPSAETWGPASQPLKKINTRFASSIGLNFVKQNLEAAQTYTCLKDGLIEFRKLLHVAFLIELIKVCANHFGQDPCARQEICSAVLNGNKDQCDLNIMLSLETVKYEGAERNYVNLFA
jgi:hypothetical protein